MKICVYGFESKSQQTFWPFQELHSRYSDSLKPSWRPRSDAALLFKQDVFFQGSIHFVGSVWVSGFASASASSSKPWATTFRTDSDLNRVFPVDFYKGMTMTSGPCGTSLRGSGGTRGSLVPVAPPNRPLMGNPPRVCAARHVGIEGVSWDKHS